MLVNFNANYITVFAGNFSYQLQCFYLLFT